MSITNVLATSQTFATGLVHTVSITVPSGADRILYATHAGSDPAVSGGFTVTYNGVALTKLAGNGLNTSGMAVYYLVNPDVGTHDLVWTSATTFTTGLYGAYVFTGVNQTTPLGTPLTLFQSYVSTSTSHAFAPVTDGVIFSYIQVRQTTGVAPTSPADLVASEVYSTWTVGVAESQPGASSIGWSGWGADKAVNHIAVMMNPVGGSPDATGTGTLTSITLTAPTGSAAGTGGATNGTGTGTLQSIILTAPAGTATGTSAGSGTITTPVMKNNTGTVLANETGVIVNVYNASTGVLIVQKTGQTSNASGIVTISDALIVPATTYAYEVVLTGSRRRLPTASAA